MICVSLLVLAGSLAVDAKSDVARRLQAQQPAPLRRLNVWDDIEDLFIDMGDAIVDVGDVVVEGWDEVDEFFTEDMVEWFEDDFVDFWVDFGDVWGDWALINGVALEEFGEWTADTFTEGWDVVVDGLEDAWEWTEDAAVAAWEFSEDLFYKFGCLVEDWTGAKCIECIRDACNATLDQETITKIDQANSYALMDMNNELDPLFEGCASAMMTCPTVSACQDFNALPDSTKAYLKNEIAQCNLCYQCLVYGSSTETCQRSLDQIWPNTCADCNEYETAMYKMYYTCSSIKAMHDGLTLLGENYAEGASAHEALDQLCEYCPNCSDYTEELVKTCTDWATISNSETGWDCQPPEVPDVLVLEGTVVGPDTPVKGSTPSSDDPVSTPGSAPVSTPMPTPPPTPMPTPPPTASQPTRPSRPTRPTPQPTPPPKRPTNGGGSTGGGRPGRGRRLQKSRARGRRERRL